MAQSIRKPHSAFVLRDQRAADLTLKTASNKELWHGKRPQFQLLEDCAGRPGQLHDDPLLTRKRRTGIQPQATKYCGLGGRGEHPPSCGNGALRAAARVAAHAGSGPHHSGCAESPRPSTPEAFRTLGPNAVLKATSVASRPAPSRCARRAARCSSGRRCTNARQAMPRTSRRSPSARGAAGSDVAQVPVQ